MSFYSELLDTGCLPARENGAAKAVFMLRTLYAQPTDLTTSHAFTSELIEQCASDKDFLKLVRLKRIRFRLRPGTPVGTPPEEALKNVMIAAMEDDQYRFENWPELLPDLRTGAMGAARNKRDAILAVLRGECSWTGETKIDKRLEVIKELFVSVKHAGFTEMEGPRAAAFQDELFKVHRHVPASHPEVRELLRKVGSLRLASRSAAYNALDQEDSLFGEFAADAKSVVDTVLNKTLARSLGQELLCIERRVPLMRSFISEEHAAATTISVVGLADDVALDELDREAAAKRMRAVVGMNITWADVRSATNDFDDRVHPDDVADARKKLAKAIVERRFVIKRDSALAGAGKVVPQVIDALSPKVLEAMTPLMAGAGGLGAGLVSHYFDGGLADFANSMLPFLSSGAGAVAGAYASNYAKKLVTDLRTKRVQQVINGFMEDCTQRAV